MSRVWWNVEPTHYYMVEHGWICHVVVPQYNLHGGYRVGKVKVSSFHTSPPSCANDSYAFENYFYHGSLGYYSFYEEAEGTYCSLDRTGYAVVDALGTFDINGWFLAQDGGSLTYRSSYWYGSVGAVWLLYRFLVLRRCFIACKRYGRMCDQMGHVLQRKPAMVFVHENLRLAAHGARNYQRCVLLYLLIEGLMSDLFLLIAHDGLFAEIQYISIGYNLSGMLLLVWEIVESMSWLNERNRMMVKRLLYSYESSLLGEFLSATVQQHLLVALNRSGLKQSRPTAMAVSYYVWSLLWHTVYVMMLIGFIVSVRVIWAVVYVLSRNRTLSIFTKPCCIDTVLGPRCRMIMLGSYRLEGERLFYKAEGLKAFGILRMEEEDGAEYMVVYKLHWITVPKDSLVVIGCVSGRLVQTCRERACTRTVRFFWSQPGRRSRAARKQSRSVRFIKADQLGSWAQVKLAIGLILPATEALHAGEFSCKAILIGGRMKQGRVHCVEAGLNRTALEPREHIRFVTTKTKLLAAWLLVGMLPFVLQARSFLRFATPHKITEALLIPAESQKLTIHLTELCPTRELYMGQTIWNVEATHYYSIENRRTCHFVAPQYNTHGNYWMGVTQTAPSFTSPASCADDSVPFEMFLYHGSIGYLAFYEAAAGTYCSRHRTAYIHAHTLGTIDVNGAHLAQYTGRRGSNFSYWYCTLGVVWLTFRAFVLRRSYVACERYGLKCDQMGEVLSRKAAMVFVNENLRLSAHGATNYQRAVLLYFLAEGLMSDLFLLVANDGIFTRVQYISLGYNLSGLLLLLFEMIENME